jgi:hypothetical protein
MAVVGDFGLKAEEAWRQVVGPLVSGIDSSL